MTKFENKWRILSTYTGMTCQLPYYTVQLQAWLVHCPVRAQIGLVITNHFREFCYGFDHTRNDILVGELFFKAANGQYGN